MLTALSIALPIVTSSVESSCQDVKLLYRSNNCCRATSEKPISASCQQLDHVFSTNKYVHDRKKLC